MAASRRRNRKIGMPFTVGFLQRSSKAMGYPLGEHRAAAAIRELQRRKVLQAQGKYRGKGHGFWVVTYRLPSVVSSVRRTRRVKPVWKPCSRKNWWQHALFGTPDGRRPP